jgi:hypothetical protein
MVLSVARAHFYEDIVIVLNKEKTCLFDEGLREAKIQLLRRFGACEEGFTPCK